MGARRAECDAYRARQYFRALARAARAADFHGRCRRGAGQIRDRLWRVALELPRAAGNESGAMNKRFTADGADVADKGRKSLGSLKPAATEGRSRLPTA